MANKNLQELYDEALQSILNQARDEMLTVHSATSTPPNRNVEERLAAVRQQLGL